MVDRHLFGDFSLAVLLALPLLALAGPQPIDHKVTAGRVVVKLVSANRVPAPGRIGLLS